MAKPAPVTLDSVQGFMKDFQARYVWVGRLIDGFGLTRKTGFVFWEVVDDLNM